MTFISKPNNELKNELQLLKKRHNSLKDLYSKHLHKSKIFQEQSRQSEFKLSESNALLEIAKEKAKIGGWVLNLKTKQIHWSEGIREILEMPPEYEPDLDEGLGFYPPEWRAKLIEVLTNCELNGIPFDEEVEVITLKGKQIWVRIIGKPNMDDNGAIVKLYGTFQDIDQQKFTENQLHKLSMAVEQSPVSIFMTDIEGNIQYANTKVTEYTGYTAAELIGKNLKIFSTSHTSKNAYKKLWNTITSVEEWHGEFHNKKKNGEIYWELGSVSPLKNKNGKITNYLAVKENITEQKQKMAALVIANKKLAFQNKEKEILSKKLIVANKELNVAKNRAEESDRLKSSFLANMSHEIRTPMNGILGFTDLLKEPDLSNEKQQKFIEIIQKSGARLLNIINDIIDISKIEAGVMQVDIQASNIREQIEYVYTFFNPEFEKKGVQFIVKKTCLEDDLIVDTDPEKIYAIFTNLIKNAIKFTNKGAVIFGYERKGKYLEFYVKDTGIGIPKDKQKDIFDRFIQSDLSKDMAIQGTGLGLSIAKAYVELLGGKIWMKSKEGAGSTFYFTIPCHQKTKEKSNVEKDAALDTVVNGTGNLKILIADDDELSETLLTAIVETISSEIMIARNGIEAVEICRNHPDIDLILMDIKMPEMNGYEATKQIREFNKDVIIIAQTAYGLSADRANSLNAGCTDYIAKPIMLDDFMTLIQKYFKKYIGAET